MTDNLRQYTLREKILIALSFPLMNKCDNLTIGDVRNMADNIVEIITNQIKDDHRKYYEDLCRRAGCCVIDPDGEVEHLCGELAYKEKQAIAPFLARICGNSMHDHGLPCKSCADVEQEILMVIQQNEIPYDEKHYFGGVKPTLFDASGQMEWITLDYAKILVKNAFLDVQKSRRI